MNRQIELAVLIQGPIIKVRKFGCAIIFKKTIFPDMSMHARMLAITEVLI